MSPYRNYSLSPWLKRLYDLSGAMGWNQKELAKALGFRTRHPIARLYAGGQPSVEVLLKLQRLEATYEGEIKEYIRQGRRRKEWQHKKLRGTLWTHPQGGGPKHIRPQDIEAMAGVAAVAKVKPKRVYPPKLRVLVKQSAAGRARYEAYREARLGRSPDKPREPERPA